jgi:hypothetical protein
LAGLDWEWKTEKYSMGHGNYLISKGVDVPEGMQNLRQKYRGDKSEGITRGHWEIQFTSSSSYNTGHKEAKGLFEVFRGYIGAPERQNAASGAGNDGAQASGGALGTVSRNLVHDGVEIAFFEKPSDSLRCQLKAAGFRITRRPPWKWYKKHSDQAFTKACELAGVNQGGEGYAGGDPSEEEEHNEDEAAGFEPGTLASDRQLAKSGLSVARFANGDVVTTNSRGRCEDAPCCGCCT